MHLQWCVIGRSYGINSCEVNESESGGYVEPSEGCYNQTSDERFVFVSFFT